MRASRLKYRTIATIAAALLAAGCATPPPGTALGPLGVIDNVLSHEGATPPSPPLVRALLADPMRAMAAEDIVRRELPEALQRLAVPPARAGEAVPLLLAVRPYLDALAEAQLLVKSAAPPLTDVPPGLPPLEAQRAIAAKVDRAKLDQAAALVLEATARLLSRPIEFPGRGTRYELGADIVVIVGSPGDDVHALQPVRDGAVRVVLEPGGDDRYTGFDVAIGGIAVIVDLGGNDRYASTGPSWGAAIGGLSLLYDAEGDDEYASGTFAQGAALAGVGILLDLGGDDRYRVEAFGQGLGLAAGTGVLWDRGGNDRYEAQGLRDPFRRGGGLSYAQGAAVGLRTGMGGGTGLLLDDAGDDTYLAQMYAQGSAYYYGLALLWDRAGRDRYEAVRYAQGAGAHQAVGVLRDESGDDVYLLRAGVGQGMGLDLAVGALADAAGDDRYDAPTLAQGAAVANGVGILSDTGGKNEWRLHQPPGHGQAEWSRGLPSVALVIGDAPQYKAPATHESEGMVPCPEETGAAPARGESFEATLRAFGPSLIRERVDPARYAFLMQSLRERPEASLGALPTADFDALWPLTTALRCALVGASAAQASEMGRTFEGLLTANPASPFAGYIAAALRARPLPTAEQHRLIALLAAHPSCRVRAAALSLNGSAEAAQSALRSSCWQLQSRALSILEARGAVPKDLSRVPAFLREASPASRPAP